jgi:plasmid stabilization system protein ParE
MTRRLVFRRAALRDFEDAALWYEGSVRAWVKSSSPRSNDALGLIQADPLLYPRVHLLVRRVRVRRSPYAVYFLVESDRIVVLSVFHARRDPRVWRARARQWSGPRWMKCQRSALRARVRALGKA